MAKAMTDTETVHEQFSNADQQRLADVLGMWIFLATETLLFGALFASFAVYRLRATEVFAEAAGHMHIWLGSINTLILLTSGLMMALADRAAEHRERRAAVRFMSITVILGLVFLVIKGTEWWLEFNEGVVPFLDNYSYTGSEPDRAALFFNYYFVMTGLHGLHMLIGLGLIAVFIWKMRASEFENNGETANAKLGDRARQLRIVGMYWAFVDVVWIFVFTTLYLLTVTG